MPAPARPAAPPLAPLLLLCALLALLPPCSAQAPPRDKYSSERVADAGPAHPYPPRAAYIPDGGCSGYLSSKLVECPGGARATQLNVTVFDYEPLPQLHIHQEKKFVTVYRAAPCAGRAVVHYQLWCPQPAARRYMLAAPAPLVALEPVPPRAPPHSVEVAPALAQARPPGRVAVEPAPPLQDLGYH